jgi:hypothetical protein
MQRALGIVIGLVIGAGGLGAGCGGGGGDDGGGDDVPDADPGPTDPQFSDPANVVVVREARWDASTTNGSLWAAFAVGATGNYTEAMRSGNCRLMTSSATYCQTVPCTGWCIDDVCHDWPTYRDAGRITFTGLKDSVALTYQSGYYTPDNFPIEADLFDGGDAITATAAGAEFPGFTVAATGVGTLTGQFTGTCANEWHIARGQDAVLRWDSPIAGTRIRAWIPSENRGHGLPSIGVIECEGPDTGELRIASALVDGMPDFREVEGCGGIACVGIDCPPATIERYAKGTTTAGSETVDLWVGSQQTFLVYDN